SETASPTRPAPQSKRSAALVECCESCNTARASYIVTSVPRTDATPSTVAETSGIRCTAGRSITSPTRCTSTPYSSAPSRKTRRRADPSRNMTRLREHRGDHRRDRRRDIVERCDAVGASMLQRRVWHAEDRRRCTVLNDCAATCLPNRQGALGPVASHAGEHHCDRRRTKRGGDRSEQ